MSTINTYLAEKDDILNIYITAGYPSKDSTIEIIKALNASGKVDLIEVGMPYSDPLADGLTIQQSSQIALQNGMKLDVLFHQLATLKGKIHVPIILMGYLNQMMQYGEERFLKEASSSGIAGLIIPDLPMGVYQDQYRSLFEKYHIGISFLITPNTSEDRIRQADALSTDFLYMVSQTSITGKNTEMQDKQIGYFERIKKLNLKRKRLIGFGIHDKNTFDIACRYADGAIIGSAYIRALAEMEHLAEGTHAFLNKIKQ